MTWPRHQADGAWQVEPHAGSVVVERRSLTSVDSSVRGKNPRPAASSHRQGLLGDGVGAGGALPEDVDHVVVVLVADSSRIGSKFVDRRPELLLDVAVADVVTSRTGPISATRSASG